MIVIGNVVQARIHINIVDQKVSARAANAYVHRNITEHSSVPTSKNCVIVPATRPTTIRKHNNTHALIARWFQTMMNYHKMLIKPCDIVINVNLMIVIIRVRLCHPTLQTPRRYEPMVGVGLIEC